jgi:D-alanyl-D-alanine dipeptidase
MSRNKLNRICSVFTARSFCGVVFLAMLLILLSGRGNCSALTADEDPDSNIMAGQQTIAKQSGPIPDESRQLVLVVAKDWGSIKGMLWTFERRPGSDKWEPAGEPFPIVVGAKGLGWGLGLHGNMDDSGPQKVEGDKKSPAGVFRLIQAFGYEAVDAVGISGFPYQQVTGHWKCVDDVKSDYYNQLVDDRQVDVVDWNSHEEMKRTDDLYQLGVVVEHNGRPVAPGAGSCIFLHLWRNSGQGTSGCTAMAKDNMVKLLQWLDEGAKPVLVQLSEGEYERLGEDWKLPSIR